MKSKLNELIDKEMFVFIKAKFKKNTTIKGEKFDWYAMNGPYSSFEMEYNKNDERIFGVVRETPAFLEIICPDEDEPMYNPGGINGEMGWVDGLKVRKSDITWEILYDYQPTPKGNCTAKSR